MARLIVIATLCGSALAQTSQRASTTTTGFTSRATSSTTSPGTTTSPRTRSSTTTIKSCRPGFAYNDAKARCIACQGGFYEFEGSCLECPAGTFNVMNAGVECYPCMAGQFCPGASNIGTDCPKDHFCPEGSIEPTRCPKNMMTESVNMSEESDCMPVSDPEPEEPEIEECEDGFYFCTKCMMCMPEKHDEPEMEKCDKGFHFCEKCQKCMPDQDDKPKCPPGLEFCDKCQMCMTIGHHDHTGGFMIPFRGGSCPSGFGLGPRRQMCLACQAGMFSGNGLVCEYCPEGTFGDMIGADHCHVCPIGHMCPNIGMSEPEKCEAGTVAEELGMEFCSLCKGGKISNKDGSACVGCADGYFAASTADMGTAGKIKNMLAIFKPEMDAHNVCLPCPEGSYCQKGIRSQCPRGSFQSRPVHSKCEACPRGHFCASGSMQPQPCRKLKMQAKQLSQQIIAGVRGKHYVSDSVPVECRMGKNLPKHMLVKPDDSHRWG